MASYPNIFNFKFVAANFSFGVDDIFKDAENEASLVDINLSSSWFETKKASERHSYVKLMKLIFMTH